MHNYMLYCGPRMNTVGMKRNIHVCMQLGMHLASISSKDEYRLVTGMLSGDGYGTESYSETTILTPCKVEASLCMLYIGMQVKVIIPKQDYR